MAQTAALAFLPPSRSIRCYSPRLRDPLSTDPSTWSSVRRPLHATPSHEESAASSSSRNVLRSDDMQSLGTEMILKAAVKAGATEPMIRIDWKADRIIVTVDVYADESYGAEDDCMFLEEEEEEWEDVLYDIEDGEDFISEEELASSSSLDFDGMEDDASSNTVSVPRIARQINEYLSRDGEGSLGDTIAELHEIEVTTPEFDNVLRGRLFQVYKGFDVIVDHWEVKKYKNKNKESSNSGGGDDVQKKRVKTEGKLVGRDMEKNVTIVNVKGRNKNIKNDLIESAELPKAKREKGVK